MALASDITRTRPATRAPRAGGAATGFVIAAAFAFWGCTPAIGDRCALSSDCSIQGNRVCDSSQPNGYCTVFSCSANSCPNNSACVEFGTSVPGCTYDDYGAPSRVARSICMRTCGANSDCRQAEGYVCAHLADPKQKSPWIAILDTNQAQGVCMIGSTPPSLGDAQVCSSMRPEVPPIDASATLQDAGEAGAMGSDVQEIPESGDVAAIADGGDASDASDASEGAANAGPDAIDDVQVDGTLEAAKDASAVDAPGGS